MILDSEEIDVLRRSGAKVRVTRASNKPSSASSKNELDYLRDIAKLLLAIEQKPEPKLASFEPPTVNVSPPQVTVEPPEVTVNLPPIERPSKWRFVIERDRSGMMKEIVATAMKP
jgi:hypothetical protein